MENNNSWLAEKREIKQKDGSFKAFYISSAAAEFEKTCNFVLSKGQGAEHEGIKYYAGFSDEEDVNKGIGKYFLCFDNCLGFFRNRLCKIRQYQGAIIKETS
jgi:hypothetical protein